MSNASVTQTQGSALQFSLRLATESDEAFLRELFASTRPEFNLLNLPESQKQSLLSMQFNAQRQQYDEVYPRAENRIVLQNDRPLGRMLVDRGEHEFTLIDIALLPENRNAGIGTNLVQRLLGEALNVRRPVRLHVWRFNPALHLYQRLGFSIVDDKSGYLEMLFQPQD